MKISFNRSTDIIAKIRKGDHQAMEHVYFKYRNEFVGWSKGKFGISTDDALDRYQDALTIFFEKVMNGTITAVESNLKTYLFGIGKNLVRQQFDEVNRLDNHSPGLTEHYRFLAEDHDSSLIYETAKKQTAKIFNSIGAGCREILKLFYFEKRSMSEIAGIMGHKSEAVSRTTKKRCLEKTRSLVNIPEANG